MLQKSSPSIISMLDDELISENLLPPLHCRCL
jgi:hypothetical protein